jgi:hypothetical protein
MQIAYIAPLSNAWKRMRKSLFKPFDIKKWFVIGFTAFLANLLEWESGSSANNNNGDTDFGDLMEFPQKAWDWVEQNPDWTTLIVLGIVVIALSAIVLTWLSSRGKFMFLDNVVHDRALVKNPWHEYAPVAKSLFLWRLGFGVVGLLIFGSYLSYIYLQIYDMWYHYASDADMIFAALRMGIFFILLATAFAYISLFLNDFVVPLMYKNKSTVWIGWSRFMPLFQQHVLSFIVYGLYVLLLYIIIGIFIAIAGLLTCCVGFLFLIIPYVGSVIVLPVSIVFRALSLEFLQQFGDQYKIFPGSDKVIEGSNA